MDDQQLPTITIIGDINVDLSFALPAFPREGGDTLVAGLRWGAGGSGLNMAVALAALGARARMLGRVGGDPAAEAALSAARRRGVDLSLIQTDPELPTGLCGVMVSPGGERSFLSYRGANPRYASDDLDRAIAAPSALLLISGYALIEGAQRQAAIQAIEIAQRRGLPCALDLCVPAIERARSIIESLLPQIWLLTLNTNELRALRPGQDIEPALEQIIGAGAATVVIKRGDQGCRVARGSSRLDALPPIVAAIDTNACGDAFTAGFAWALLQQADLADCAALANLMGALTAARPGAVEAIPERREVLRELAAPLRALVPPLD